MPVDMENANRYPATAEPDRVGRPGGSGGGENGQADGGSCLLTRGEQGAGKTLGRDLGYRW